MKNLKKAQFPVIKTILIIIITIFILITYIIDLSSNKIILNEQKLNTQLTIKKIFNSNCFSNKYATIELDKFNQEKLDNCFKGNQKILAKLIIENKNTNPLYIGEKEKFQFKAQLCNSKSNLLCSKLIYPINIITSKNKQKRTNLILYIISQ